MNSKLKIVLFSIAAFFFSSCATIKSVSAPDLSKEEYAELVKKQDQSRFCYVRKMRPVVIGEIIWGIYLMEIPWIIDAIAGNTSYFQYDARLCRVEPKCTETYP